MHVAIVGSRNYHHIERVDGFVACLAKDIILVSGGAKGADTAAREAALKYGLELIEILVAPEEWMTLGRRAGPLRNQKIVDAADMVVVFWDGESSGTFDTIQRATKDNKKLFVCLDGDDNVKEATITNM